MHAFINLQSKIQMNKNKLLLKLLHFYTTMYNPVKYFFQMLEINNYKEHSSFSVLVYISMFSESILMPNTHEAFLHNYSWK